MKILIDIKKNKNPSEPYKLKITIPTACPEPNVCEMECNSLSQAIDSAFNELHKHKQDIMEVALGEMKPKKSPPKPAPEAPESPPKKAKPKGKPESKK